MSDATKAEQILSKYILTAEMESGIWAVKNQRGQVLGRMTNRVELLAFATGVEVGWKIAKEASNKNPLNLASNG
jgi:hypothetical protein